VAAVFLRHGRRLGHARLHWCAVLRAKHAFTASMSPPGKGSLSQSNWNNNSQHRWPPSPTSGLRAAHDRLLQPERSEQQQRPERCFDAPLRRPDFVQNITNATNAGMFAGPYHFGRMDIFDSLHRARMGNTGTGRSGFTSSKWPARGCGPGYLLPVFDFEAGTRRAHPPSWPNSQSDFSDEIYERKAFGPPSTSANKLREPN